MNNKEINNYKEYIKGAAKRYNVDPRILAEIITAENNWITVGEKKTIWTRIVSIFRKCFRIKVNQQIKPTSLGLGIFSINQVDKENK